MIIRDAREELEQYIKTREFDCSGSQWGYCHRHYATVDDANAGRVTSRTWTPTWGTHGRIVRTSLQLCIPGHETFPSPQAYAAQVNWNHSMRALMSKEPSWRTAKVRRAPEYKVGAWNDTRAIYELLVKEPPSTAVLRRAPQGEVT